jgi:parallel beta-helix repeat protein
MGAPIVPPQSVPPLLKPPGPGAPPDPTALLFTQTWWLFFQQMAAFSAALTTPTVPVFMLKSPLDFGGIGDGNTDDSSAVASAAALGYLWLPPGYMFVTTGLTITANDFWVFGGGGLMLKAGTGTDLLTFDGSAFTGGLYPGNGLYGHIFGITLIGNAANQPVNLGACLHLKNAAYTTVQDCLIYGGSGDGIRLENANGCFQADEINIINNRIFSNGRHGIYLLPTSLTVATTIAADVAIGQQTVTPASMANIEVGATLIVANSDTSNLEYVVISAVTATTFTGIFASTKTGPGITVVSTFGHVGDHVLIGNHCNYNGSSGIRGTRCTSNIISGNNVLTNATGIYLDAADRCTILGNAVRNNKGTGVLIDEDQSGNGFGHSIEMLIEANQLHYNNIETPEGDELDVFNTDGCQILGNYLGDTDFTPVALYGIQLSGCTGIVMGNNNFGPTIHGPLLANGVPYRSTNNIGLADDMQGLLAELPAPALNDYGLPFWVTDYEHLLLWIGDQWVFAFGDPASGWIVNTASDSGPTGGIYHVCDGTDATLLQGGGTTLVVTTPNLGSTYYIRL